MLSLSHPVIDMCKAYTSVQGYYTVHIVRMVIEVTYSQKLLSGIAYAQLELALPQISRLEKRGA